MQSSAQSDFSPPPISRELLATTFWDRNPGYKYKKVAVIGPGFGGAQPIPGLVRDAGDFKIY